MLIAETQVAAQTEPYRIRLAPVKLVVRLRQSARIRRTVPISGPLEKASLEESVGKFWFGKGAEVVIECGFIGFLGAETVRFSGDQF